VTGELRRGRVELGRLRRDDREVRLGEFLGRDRRADSGGELVTARDTEAVLVQRRGVLVAAT